MFHYGMAAASEEPPQAVQADGGMPGAAQAADQLARATAASLCQPPTAVLESIRTLAAQNEQNLADLSKRVDQVGGATLSAPGVASDRSCEQAANARRDIQDHALPSLSALMDDMDDLFAYIDAAEEFVGGVRQRVDALDAHSRRVEAAYDTVKPQGVRRLMVSLSLGRSAAPPAVPELDRAEDLALPRAELLSDIPHAPRLVQERLAKRSTPKEAGTGAEGEAEAGAPEGAGAAQAEDGAAPGDE